MNSIWEPEDKVVVLYEGQDVHYNGCLYTRVLRKGSGGVREWIYKGSLPDNPIVDTQYEIDRSKYHAVRY